jgi:hypothetical protein
MKRIYKHDGFIFLLLVSAMLLLIVVTAGKQQQNPAQQVKPQILYTAPAEDLFYYMHRLILDY